MALQQSGAHGRRLYRTQAFKTLDPTEKGAISYFLGMVLCKLFADKLLGCPWLLHLDVFRPQINPVLMGKSRPDLVGNNVGLGQWHAFESKGRSNPPDVDSKNKAKSQASRLVNVDGTACSLHIGAITYFKRDVLNFYWQDPAPEPSRGFGLTTSSDLWRHYYQPVADMVTAADAWSDLIPRPTNQSLEQPPTYISLSNFGIDLKVSISPIIAVALERQDWNLARATAVRLENVLLRAGYQRDGLAIKSGPTWLLPFNEIETAESN